MSGPPVEFRLEMVLHLPRPADLDACARPFKRLGIQDATLEKHAGSLRLMLGECHFPEVRSRVFVTIGTLTERVPPPWRPPEGTPGLVAWVACHDVPREHAVEVADEFFQALRAIALASGAVAGFIDLGERQRVPDPPRPWATIRRQGRRWGFLGKEGVRVETHRGTPFPDGFQPGKLGFPLKRSPVPACLVVAGAVLPADAREDAERAKQAGLNVWKAEFVSKPPCMVAGLLVAHLTLSQHEAHADPEVAAALIEDARVRLARAGVAGPVGLRMVRVGDLEEQ